MTITNDDGTIDEIVSVSLDRDAIEDNGLDLDTVKSDIELSSLNEAKQIVYQFNSRLQTDLMLNINSEAHSVLSSFINGIEVVGNEWSDDTYVIGIRFKNDDVYRYYYNITETVEVETTTEEHFFYDKVSYQSYTMYMNYGDLYTRLSAYYSYKYPQFNMTDTELVYTYVADSSRQHSNADYVTRVQGKYYHSWVVDGSGEVVTFHYNIANRTNWIIVCIGVAILTAGVLGIVDAIKNKINKKEKIN